MGAIALRGEVALLVESWYIPTTFVPPCCANQLYRWRMSLASSDLRFRRPRCPGSFHKVPHPYVTSDAYVANDFLRSSQLGSIVSVTEPATPSQLAEVARNPPSTPNTSLRVPFPTTPTEDPTSSPLDPPGGSDEDPIRMFNDRPHQYFTLLVANLSSLGAILGPDSPDWSRPVPPGTTSVAFPPDALPWNSSSMSPSLSALTRFSTFFDGTTASGLCYYEFATKTFQNSPPWQPPIGSLLQRRGHPLRTCYGGHNSSCDVFSLDCGIVGRVQYAIDARDAHARYCAPDTILGSLQPSHISSRAHSWWQMGYSPLNVWYKPCEACGPMAAVRAGANRTELPECDIASCVANITRVVQRRVVAPWTVPSPGSLAALREADEGAFPWYACRSSARVSFLSGYPACVPLCSGDEPSPAWPGQAIGWQAAPEGPGMAAGRTWLMAWSGVHGGSEQGRPAACSPATPILEAAARSGRLRIHHRSRTVDALAPADGSQGGAGIAPAAAAALLSPLLSTASVAITLNVPLGQLHRTSRGRLLAETAAEAAAAAGGDLTPCILVTCEDCPPASDGSVWANTSLDPKTNRPPVPARATRLVRLQLRAWIPPQGACGHGNSSFANDWLVDARAARGEEAFPVVFAGKGRNERWLRQSPRAAQTRHNFLALASLSARTAPAVQALSLAEALSDAAAHRTLGAWLVWADQTPTAPTVVTACLGDELVSTTGTTSVIHSSHWWAPRDSQGSCETIPSRTHQVSIAMVALAAVASTGLLLLPGLAACPGMHTGPMQPQLAAEARRLRALSMWAVAPALARVIAMCGVLWILLAVGSVGAGGTWAAITTVALVLVGSATSCVAAGRTSQGPLRLRSDRSSLQPVGGGHTPASSEVELHSELRLARRTRAPGCLRRPLDSTAVVLGGIGDATYAARAWQLLEGAWAAEAEALEGGSDERSLALLDQAMVGPGAGASRELPHPLPLAPEGWGRGGGGHAARVGTLPDARSSTCASLPHPALPPSSARCHGSSLAGPRGSLQGPAEGPLRLTPLGSFRVQGPAAAEGARKAPSKRRLSDSGGGGPSGGESWFTEHSQPTEETASSSAGRHLSLSRTRTDASRGELELPTSRARHGAASGAGHVVPLAEDLQPGGALSTAGSSAGSGSQGLRARAQPSAAGTDDGASRGGSKRALGTGVRAAAAAQEGPQTSERHGPATATSCAVTDDDVRPPHRHRGSAGRSSSRGRGVDAAEQGAHRSRQSGGGCNRAVQGLWLLPDLAALVLSLSVSVPLVASPVTASDVISGPIAVLVLQRMGLLDPMSREFFAPQLGTWARVQLGERVLVGAVLGTCGSAGSLLLRWLRSRI